VNTDVTLGGSHYQNFELVVDDTASVADSPDELRDGCTLLIAGEECELCDR
jgi:hypothetical protein